MMLHTAPSDKQFEYIKQWLMEEYERLQAGFFCNWSTIEKSYRKNEFVVFEEEGESIGFIVWTNNDYYAEIDIMEIHPAYRNRGLGKVFYELVERYFRSKNLKAIKLFCAPEESEPFWQRMDFVPFPDRGYTEHALMYYKPIVANNLSTDMELRDKLELWNSEPIAVQKGKPATWTWEIKENQLPIVQPCNPNWNLRLTRHGKVVREEKVKYFFLHRDGNIDPFLYIEAATLRDVKG